MGYFLRKAFRAGPIRINLSKGGFGVSAGVTGGRVGITSDGRTYTHVGRYGVYSRHYHGRIGDEDSGGRSRGRSPSAPIVLEADTNVTYGATPVSTEPPLAETRLRDTSKGGIGSAILFLGAGILGIVAYLAWPLSKTHGIGFATAALVLGTTGLLVGIRAWRQGRSGHRFGQFVVDCAAQGAPLTEEQLSELRVLVSETNLWAADRDHFSRLAYLDALARIAEDRRIDDDELELLGQLESELALDPAFVERARLDVFRTVYLEAVADHELTEAEESTLEHLRERLAIPSAAISEELQDLDELKKLRAIIGGDLPVVDSGKNLRRGETCHFLREGRILKSRVQGRFQRDGQKYTVQGLEIDKEGELLVTNKRILLVHSGTSSIPLSKVLDVEVDWDRNLISITKDGVQKPVLISTPEAAVAGAIIAHVARTV